MQNGHLKKKSEIKLKKKEGFVCKTKQINKENCQKFIRTCLPNTLRGPKNIFSLSKKWQANCYLKRGTGLAQPYRLDFLALHRPKNKGQG